MDLNFCYGQYFILIVNFSNFKILFRYLPKIFLSFGILGARFEPAFTKNIKCLSDEIFICKNISICEQDIGDVLALDFSVTTDFIPSQLFLRFFEFI